MKLKVSAVSGVAKEIQFSAKAQEMDDLDVEKGPKSMSKWCH